MSGAVAERTLRLEAWGANSIRVRARMMADMLDTDYALLPPPEGDSREVDIEVDADVAVLRNGKMHWLAQPEWRREGANRTGLHGLRIERRYARLDVLRAVER